MAQPDYLHNIQVQKEWDLTEILAGGSWLDGRATLVRGNGVFYLKKSFHIIIPLYQLGN